MKKQIVAAFTLLGMILSPLASYAEDCENCEEEDSCAPAYAYFDEDDEFFNRGTFVGVENDDWIRARRRQRYKNWGVATAATLAGIVTLILKSGKK